MLEKTRNKRIAELYKSGNYTFTKIGNIYNITRERVKQIIQKEIGKEAINVIKTMRKIRVAEKIKEDYLKNI